MLARNILINLHLVSTIILLSLQAVALTLISQLSRIEYRALLKLLEYLIYTLFELSLKYISARFSFSKLPLALILGES